MEDVDDFPTDSLLPKRETAAASFLTKYPEFDGHGIRIAILDTGVDPAAAGLQTTSQGLPKILDVIDVTGAGDVDTSTVVDAKDGIIIGLTGRSLKIPTTWHNPSGSYHIGMVVASHLYPKGLKDRMNTERKEKKWNVPQRIALAEATRERDKFDADHPSTSTLTQNEKMLREDLHAKVMVLTNLEKKYSNYSPLYDCVVFYNGSTWRACVDTSEEGNLSCCKLLASYKEERQYSRFSDIDMLNFTVTIHNEGNLLEIAVNAGSHGTHVASIAAAYFPDSPAHNGIAPGAQIVSIKVGDTRLGSMETGTSLTRAIMKVLEYKCDIVNMSYGESTHWPVTGYPIEALRELVRKHGVIFVATAGNSGPALSTLTAPGGTCSEIIGVGAYVSPAMMAAEYSLREKMPATQYSWSSRGPCVDGDLGVDISAPGGAITCVANWSLRACQLMNGTSMSAPNATGCIALLLCGLKEKSLPYTPYSIRRALEHCAVNVEGVETLALGNGLIHVAKTFEHLTTYTHLHEMSVFFSVTVTGRKRGIYIRDRVDVGQPHSQVVEQMVTVEPKFIENESISNADRVNFSMSVCLVCDEAWVHCAPHFQLMNAPRSFSVKVDTAALEEGVHHTQICGYDSKCRAKGPLFKVPITVIKPMLVKDQVNYRLSWQNQSFKPAQIRRYFIHVPDQATLAVFKIRSHDENKGCRIQLHAVQLSPQHNHKLYNYERLFSLQDLGESMHAFPVMGGKTLELCISKWWSNIGHVTVDYRIEFHSVNIDQSTITMFPVDGVKRFTLTSGLKHEDLSLTISLKDYVQPLRPSDQKIVVLNSVRDVLSNGRHAYAHEFSYNFSLVRQEDIMVDVSVFSDTLYESEYQSQLWMMYDVNKQYICSGDAYPSQYCVKLDKGDYTIRLQIRHDKRDLLEKLKDLVILIHHQRLATPITLDLYPLWPSVFTNGKKLSALYLKRGIVCPVYVAPIPDEKLPKGITPGSYLYGSLTTLKDEPLKKASAIPFRYIIPELPKKAVKNEKKEEKKTKSKEEELKEAIRDTTIDWLTKIEDSAKVYEELLVDYPDYLPLHVARLNSLDASKVRSSNLKAIIEIGEKIISLIDQSELLEYYGMKLDYQSDASNRKIEMDKRKSTLIDAIVKVGCAKCDLLLEKPAGTDSVTTDITTDPSTCDTDPVSDELNTRHIDEIYCDVQKWVDVTDIKVSSFVVKHATVHKHYGRALKCLQKIIDEKATNNDELKFIEIAKALNWSHCVEHLNNALLARYPPAFRLF